MAGALDRRLGLPRSVAIGVAAMVGAGLFVVFPLAVAAAGTGLFVALGLAATVALCNAWSSARLARRHPVAGGTYVYGRERLGPFWGHLAGWAFVAGKLASCAAMAFALGGYLVPEHTRTIAIATVVAVTALNLAGIEKSAAVSVAVVVVVLVITVAAVAAMLVGPADTRGSGGPAGSPGGVLEAAGLLFFAFAGYARLATLGEEVRDPERTIPRAIAVSFTLVVTVYALAAAALVHALGTSGLARTTRPFVTGLEAVGADALVPFIAVAAALAAGGALASLTLGISRTMLAMARDAHLPRALSAVSPRTRVPHVAEIAVGVIVCVLLLSGDLVTSVAFSSFCVLVYYAIANASAWTLSARNRDRIVPILGLAGCLALAAGLPAGTIVAGSAVVAAGALSYAVRHPRHQT